MPAAFVRKEEEEEEEEEEAGTPPGGEMCRLGRSMDIRRPRREGLLFHMCVPMCTCGKAFYIYD